MQFRYNSPVILTFSLISILVLVLDKLFALNIIGPYFSVGPSVTFSFFSPISWFRHISYTLGHANWEHLFGNLTLMLLVGPMIEEKYTSGVLLIVMLATAASTAILNNLLLSTGMVGASGIVFMLIILASITESEDGEIPLTFVLIAAIFIPKELIGALSQDNVSHFGHLAGGLFGGIFGFALKKIV